MNAESHHLNDHDRDMRRRWSEMMAACPEFEKHCDVTEAYSGGIGARVPGSAAYWYERTKHGPISLS